MDTKYMTGMDNRYQPRTDYTNKPPPQDTVPGTWGHTTRTEFDENYGRPKEGLGGSRLDVGRTPGGERSWAGKVTENPEVLTYGPRWIDTEDPTPIDWTRKGPKPQNYWSLDDPRTSTHPRFYQPRDYQEPSPHGGPDEGPFEWPRDPRIPYRWGPYGPKEWPWGQDNYAPWGSNAALQRFYSSHYGPQMEQRPPNPTLQGTVYGTSTEITRRPETGMKPYYPALHGQILTQRNRLRHSTIGNRYDMTKY